MAGLSISADVDRWPPEEERWAILEHIGEGIVYVDQERSFRYINPQAERLLKRQKADLLGRSARALFPNDTGILTHVGLARQAQGAPEGPDAVIDVFSHSLQRWFEVRAYPAASGTIAFFHDISERKQAEEALRASESRFRAIFTHAAVGISICDARGRFLHVNDAFCAITGYTAEELTRRDIISVTHPDDLDENQDLLRQLLAGIRPSFVVQKRYLRADGAAIWVQNSVSLVRDDHGAPLHSIALTEDISGRKLAEQESLDLAQRLALSEKLEAVGRLAAGVAHDMNNSLAAIVGPLELLQRAMTDGAASREAIRQEVDTAARAASDAAHGVRRLLRFARQSREPETEERERLHLESLLDDVVALTRPRWRDEAQAHGRRIEVVVEPSATPAIMAGPAEMRDALVNLVNNAVDALPDGGTVTLATRSDRGADGREQAVVSVTDTGVGMDAVTQRRLFEPFYTTKPIGKGTGLGLAMVHGIVGRHGGTINISSLLGRGTCVALWFPADGDIAGPDEIVTTGPQETRTWRLLLVDDEPAIRDVATRLLQREGHQVVAVATGEAALALLECATGPEAFDALVTDVGLPGMSGWQLIERVRLACLRLPIVVASGWGYSMTKAELAIYGISPQQVVAKPYRLAVLRQALEAAIAAPPPA